MMEDIPSKLIELRTKHNLTKTEMAKRIGVTTGAYANWEYGNRTPSYDRLIKIARAFNLPTDYFYVDMANHTYDRITNYIKENKRDKYNLDEIFYYFTDILEFIMLPLSYPSEEASNVLTKLMFMLRFGDNSSIIALSKMLDSTIGLLDANAIKRNSVTDESFEEAKKEIITALDNWWDIQKNHPDER